MWWLIWRDVFPYPIFCQSFEDIWDFGFLNLNWQHWITLLHCKMYIKTFFKKCRMYEILSVFASSTPEKVPHVRTSYASFRNLCACYVCVGVRTLDTIKDFLCKLDMKPRWPRKLWPKFKFPDKIEMAFIIWDHPFKTSANFHDFWPLPSYHQHSNKMLMKGIFDPYVQSCA